MILPDEFARTLRAYRDNKETENLYNYVSSLQESGWSARSIASALDVSPTTVSTWGAKGTASDKFDVDEPDVRRSPGELPSETVQRLSELAKGAASVSRNTPRRALSRQQSHDLNVLLRELYEQNYSLRQLADACSVTRGAIQYRLRKEAGDA